jgi:hypothetical protein
VHEPRKCQLLGSAAPTQSWRALENGDPVPGPGQDDGRREAIWARADNDGVGCALRQRRGRAGGSPGRLAAA